MPRPPTKKAKKNSSREEDLTVKKGKKPASETDSSDDLKNLSTLMKSKRASKGGNQSFDNFESKCYKLIKDTTDQIDSKIANHEENLGRLYRSVEQINEEIEPMENEAMVDKVIHKTFDQEINRLSRALTNMTCEKSCGGDELPMDSGLLEELNTRPEQLAEFSRRMTYECKKEFRMYCENNKLASDSQKFKEKYKALMREVL